MLNNFLYIQHSSDYSTRSGNRATMNAWRGFRRGCNIPWIKSDRSWVNNVVLLFQPRKQFLNWEGSSRPFFFWNVQLIRQLNVWKLLKKSKKIEDTFKAVVSFMCFFPTFDFPVYFPISEHNFSNSWKNFSPIIFLKTFQFSKFWKKANRIVLCQYRTVLPI